jgi:hypothetical protein
MDINKFGTKSNGTNLQTYQLAPRQPMLHNPSIDSPFTLEGPSNMENIIDQEAFEIYSEDLTSPLYSYENDSFEFKATEVRKELDLNKLPFLKLLNENLKKNVLFIGTL